MSNSPKASASSSSNSPKTPAPAPAPNPNPTFWQNDNGWEFAGQVSPTTKEGQDLKYVGQYVVRCNTLGLEPTSPPGDDVNDAIDAVMSYKTLSITTGLHINAILYLLQKVGYNGEIVVRDEEMKRHLLSLMPSFPADKVLLPGVPTAEEQYMKKGDWFKEVVKKAAAAVGAPPEKREEYSAEAMSTSEEEEKLDENELSDPDKLD